MAVPTYAINNNWVNCNVDDEGKVTIGWNSEYGISELRIIRSGVTFKSFTQNVPNSGSFSLTETETGTFDYEVMIYGRIGWMDNILFAKTQQKLSVKGTGKPKIWLDFVNAYTNDPNNTVYYPPVARVKNWVNIKNIGTTDLDLNKLMIRYFYTIDGEPSTVKDTFPNNGQQKAEESDGRINPIEPYTEYAVGRRDIQAKDSIRMDFLKIPFNVTNENGKVVADYICETYFESTTDKVDSAYYLKLQPAFDKKNLTSIESDHERDTYIRNYDLTNDFSFNNNQNIAVYYDGVKIWGLDPTVIVPKNLTGKYINYKIELDWDDSPGASGYTVYKSESRDGEFRKIAVNIDKSNYTDSDVEMPNQSVGKKYYYKVVAHYNKIFSDESNIAEVEVSELKAPTNLTASVIDEKNVKLEWNESLGATKYNVYRSESENGVYSKIKSDVTETNFIDYNAKPQGLKKTYYYKIKAAAENSGSTIESEFSNFAAATIINLPIPTNLTAKLVNIKNVELKWADAEGAVGYTIYRSDSENGDYKAIKTISEGNTFVDSTTTLAHNFKNYYYKVSAIYNIDGSIIHSAKSDNVSVPMPRKKLEAPNDLKAAQYGTQVLLDWTPSTGAVYYIILRSEYENSGFNEIATIDAIDAIDIKTGKASYIDTSVPEVTDSVGKNYYYRLIAAYDETDKSDASNTASVMITVYIGGSNDYFDWFCRVISSKGKSDFVLGTYIPVSFTITINKDVEYLNLVLDKNLINPTFDVKKNNYNLNTSVVSLKNGTTKKLIKTTLTNSILNDASIDSYVSIPVVLNSQDTVQNIDINRQFKQGDVICIEFAIKSSANEQVIGDVGGGIEKYYGDKYDLSFKMEAKDSLTGEEIERSASSATGTRLNIKILKPDKLQ